MALNTSDEKVANPKYQNWSHQPITFSRADQWANILEPGHFPLVLDLVIRNVRFEKVLIDGGSALDILFHNTLTKLDIKLEGLEPYDTPFLRSAPGADLSTFGTYHTGSLVWHRRPLTYRLHQLHCHRHLRNNHTILGQLALSMFMAIPLYIYLILKMSTKKGVLSLKGNVLIAYH
jgi:hypothetical protein